MKFNRNTLVVHRILFSRPRAVFDWVDRAGSLGSLGRKNRAFVPKRQVCSAGQWRASCESSMTAARRPACHTIVLGPRTLRPRRWLDVNVDVIGHNQHGFPLPAHPAAGATSLDSRCMLPRSALLLPRSLLSLSLTLCSVCYYTMSCTTLCLHSLPTPFTLTFSLSPY